jgi:SSS family solute:Na+ symporter
VALVGSVAAGLFIALRRGSAKQLGFFSPGAAGVADGAGASLFATNIGAEHLVGLSGDLPLPFAGTVGVTSSVWASPAVLFPTTSAITFSHSEFLELRFTTTLARRVLPT